MDPDSDPLFPQAACNRQELNLHLSLDSLEDDEGDSLSEERRYQSELQNRIHINEENFLHTANGESKDVQNENMGTTHQDHTAGEHNHSRAQIAEASYSELRYDPGWRRHQSLHNRSEDEEEVLEESPRYSELLSPEVPRHRPHRLDTSAIRSQNATTTSLYSDVQSKITTTQPVQHQGANHRTRGSKALPKTRTTSDKRGDVVTQDAAREDFIERNKATLGVHRQRNNSYLHLYKKNDENSSDQNNIQPVTIESHPVKAIKGKSPLEMASTEERGSSDGRSNQRRSKTTNIEIVSPVRKDKMEIFSGQPRVESSEIDTFSQGRFRNIYLQPQEDPEIHVKSFVNWNMKPQELTLNGNLGATGEDIFDKHSGLRTSQVERQSLQEISVTYPVKQNLGCDTFFPEHYAPLNDSSSTRSRGGESNPIDNVQKTRKEDRVEEKSQKMLISYLKQEVKLGGIGPSHIISQERKEQLRQQKEYAKIIQERNRNKPMKVREMPMVQNDNIKGPRQKSLEYARSIPRPEQSSKAATSEKQLVGGVRRAMSYDTLLPHNKLLDDLKARHEQEKVAVASISALHLI